LGGLHEKQRSSNLELGSHLNVWLKTEEKHEKKLCRHGRSQDLPNAHWTF
jgi:hypothetical protein